MFDFFLKNKKRFEEKRSQAGFMMIELIVALFIFGIVMTISIGSLVTALDSNRKAQALKSVLNNLEIAMSTLTKTMSAGRFYQCAEVDESDFVFTNTEDQGGCDTEDPDGHTAISFVSNENLDGDPDTRDAVVYRLNAPEDGIGGFLERKRFKCVLDGTFDANGVDNCTSSSDDWEENDEEWVRMTAPEISITNLKFYMSGTAPAPDLTQPKVTIHIVGQVQSAPRTGSTEFAVQTVVTQLIPDF